ncbi:MAG TPA: hypothetical protein VFH25_05995 [Nitrososphaeraceae archaeon]|nr:hypothetical protein [Nitrososphaeraceae archaeon]HEX6029362.1 hypothetical protein [Nitrososphaeraceae archaeon]
MTDRSLPITIFDQKKDKANVVIVVVNNDIQRLTKASSIIIISNSGQTKLFETL